MKLLITQSNYIPWKGYFDAINMVDRFILYEDVQYTRRDWRNRNIIKTPSGPQWLTIPVEVKGKFRQRIRDVRVSSDDWRRRHWRTLSMNYSKASHFAEMADFVNDLYEGTRSHFLSEINYRFLSKISSRLNIRTPFEFSDGYTQNTNDPSERLVEICVANRATHYYTGPAAKAYLDESRFARENIRICYLDYEGYPEYPQLYPPFNHKVSILDLLFNTGADAWRYMKSFES